MARKIYCDCGKYLGEIRDATLSKEITYRCKSCAAKNENESFSGVVDSLNKYLKNKKGYQS